MALSSDRGFPLSPSLPPLPSSPPPAGHDVVVDDKPSVFYHHYSLPRHHAPLHHHPVEGSPGAQHDGGAVPPASSPPVPSVVRHDTLIRSSHPLSSHPTAAAPLSPAADDEKALPLAAAIHRPYDYPASPNSPLDDANYGSSVSERVHSAVSQKRSQLLRDASAELASRAAKTSAASPNTADFQLSMNNRNRWSRIRPSTAEDHLGSMYQHRVDISSPAGDARQSRSIPDDAPGLERKASKKGKRAGWLRRIFSKKAKTPEQKPDISLHIEHGRTLRHAYHQSDPTSRPRPMTAIEQPRAKDRTKTLSVPPQERALPPTPTPLAAHAPPAFEFPQSRNLKPLDLTGDAATPFARRATIANESLSQIRDGRPESARGFDPEVDQVTASEETQAASEVPKQEDDQPQQPNRNSATIPRASYLYNPEKTIGLALTKDEGYWRRSRSAENLLNDVIASGAFNRNSGSGYGLGLGGLKPSRPTSVSQRSFGTRSDEIKYWRTSFTVPPLNIDPTAPPQNRDSIATAQYRPTTPPSRSHTTGRRSRTEWTEGPNSPRNGRVFSYEQQQGLDEELVAEELAKHQDETKPPTPPRRTPSLPRKTHPVVAEQERAQQDAVTQTSDDGTPYVTSSPPPTFLNPPTPRQNQRALPDEEEPFPESSAALEPDASDLANDSTLVAADATQVDEIGPQKDTAGPLEEDAQMADNDIEPHDSAHFPSDSTPTLDSLAAQLSYERAARLRLEAQVQQLQRDLASLQALMDLSSNTLKRLSAQAAPREPPFYLPTPSPDEDRNAVNSQQPGEDEHEYRDWARDMGVSMPLATSRKHAALLQDGDQAVVSRFSGFESDEDVDPEEGGETDQTIAMAVPHGLGKGGHIDPIDTSYHQRSLSSPSEHDRFETPVEQMSNYSAHDDSPRGADFHDEDGEECRTPISPQQAFIMSQPLVPPPPMETPVDDLADSDEEKRRTLRPVQSKSRIPRLAMAVSSPTAEGVIEGAMI